MANTFGDFDITTISGYVSENEYDLIAKSILETDLGAYLNVRVGLKGDVVKIPLLGGDFNTQDGSACGFNPDNTTEITQVTMELANKKWNATYCSQVLRDTFLSQSLAAGAMAGGESVPMEALMADYFVKQLKSWNENFMINGDGAIDGYNALIQAANGAALQGGTPAAWTIDNALSQAWDLAAAVPAVSANASDLIMVVSPSSYRTLKLAIAKSDLYHYGPTETVYVPGTSIEVVASAGLNATAGTEDYKFVGPKSALLMGGDLLSDYDQFKLFYAEAEDEIRAIMRWRIGVAVTEINLFAENGL